MQLAMLLAMLLARDPLFVISLLNGHPHPPAIRLLIEGGYYLFRARAMTDTAARMRYVYIRTYAGQRPPDEFIARAATIRGRLLFFCASATCGYYSRAATIRCAAIIRINTVP